MIGIKIQTTYDEI